MMSNFDELSELFKIFADTTRLQILKCIENGEKSVGDIVSELGMTQSAISHQLNTLRKSKLVKARKVGKSSLYSLDDDHVHEILTSGINHIGEEKR